MQDVWVRWQTTDRTVVRDAAAFLATTATRLAINVMQSARSRRETVRRALAAGTGRHQRRPRLGAERGEALDVRGSVAAGEAVAHGTSRVHPSGGVRLSIPRHRGHPSARRSQRAPNRDPRPATRREWPEDRPRMPTEQQTSSRRVHRSGHAMATSPASNVSLRRTSSRRRTNRAHGPRRCHSGYTRSWTAART